MKRARISFFVAGLLCIGLCAVVLFQNAQTSSPVSNIINIFFIVFGVVINFTQLFFPFPLVNENVNKFFMQIFSLPKGAVQSYPPGSLSRGSRYLLRARGLCFVVLGVSIILLDDPALSFTWAIAMLVAGMATIGMAVQEWNVSSKRRWFLPEGIIEVLSGLITIMLQLTHFQWLSPAPAYTLIDLGLWLLIRVLWVIVASISEIRASNGWALTAGGVLSLLAIIIMILGVVTDDKGYLVLAYYCCYPILFGITSIIGASQ